MRRRIFLLTALAAAVGAAAVVLALLIADVDTREGRRVLVAAGRAERRITPDVATVTFAATARATSAQAAMRSSSGSIDRVVGAVRRVGVDEVRSLPVRLRRLPQADRGRPIPGFRRYEATQAVTARVVDLETLPGLIDAVVAAGADEVTGPRFGLIDPGAARRPTVADAVEAARRRASAMADAAGMRLGPPVEIREREGGWTPVARERATSATTPAPDSVSPPVEPGTLTVTASVTVTFEAEPA